MNRRQFIKRSTMACAAVALLPGRLPAQADKSAAQASSGEPGTGASGTGKVPDYAKHMLHSDMVGLGPDGKPTGQKATFTGASKANAKAEKAMRHKMKLTKEEQAILDGKKGEQMAKLMKILVVFGNTFGASIVKGFSITLALGVLVSLFTAISVTRTFLHIVLDNIRFADHPRWFGI